MDQAKPYKVLVLFADEDEEKQWKDDKLNKTDGHFKFVDSKTTNEAFIDGERFNRFQIVLVYSPTSDQDSIEMQEEFFRHYSYAPIIVVISEESEESRKFYGAETIYRKPEGDNKSAVEAGLAKGVKLYNKKLESDVIPAFNKFDKDGSDKIDKSEFA
jgi:hypothetical protein